MQKIHIFALLQIREFIISGFNNTIYKMKTEEKIFFSGINGLRFFAALAVIITHIELLKGSFEFKSYWKNPIIFNLGGLGVYFFFVLSGFLITFLLLSEKQKFNTIKIKEFYYRRILRIWPLYYLILILGFFVLPHFKEIQIPYLQDNFIEHYNANLILYLFILPNVAFALFMAVPHIGQLWSIGVEEQFYLFWPWLVLKAKNTVKALLYVIFILILIKFTMLVLGKFYGAEKWYEPLKLIIAMSKFECMALGGIGACILFQKNDKLLKLVYNKYVLASSILFIPLLMLFTPPFLQDGIHLVYSVIFLIIILNVTGNKTIFFSLENKYLNFLGKISYGLYMYHFLLIPIILYYMKPLKNAVNETWANVIIYSLVIVSTVVVSAISFYCFENIFIKKKAKYSPIKSGS